MGSETEAFENRMHGKKQITTMTGRELLKALADISELDSEVAISIFNSDPVPVASVEESEDGQIVIYGQT